MTDLMPIPAHNMKSYELTNAQWRVIMPADIQRDDLTKPDLWSELAAMFNPHDIVLAVAEDDSWFAQLIVTECTPKIVLLVVISYTSLAKQPVMASDCSKTPLLEIPVAAPVPIPKSLQVLRPEQVCNKLGISRVSLWRLTRTDANFPKPRRLGTTSKIHVFLEHEIDEYITNAPVVGEEAQ